MKTSKYLMTVAALAVLFLLPAAAQADPVSFILDDSKNGAAGSTITFMGSLANAGAPARFLFDVSLSIAGPAGAFTPDFTPLFTAYPAAIPGAGPLVAIFDLAIDAGVAPGAYVGSMTVILSDAAGGNLIEVTQDFSVIVGGQTAAVPEPATMLLLGSGLAGLAAASRRKRKRRLAP